MNILTSILALLPLAFASDVLEFTDSNFAEKASQINLMLVEFYAPWCGHCKKLAPEYEKAATSLASNDPPVPLVKVDCTAEKDICSKFGVSGYPTLKIFRGGELSEDYNGPREAAGIIKHMQSIAGPTSKELTTIEDAEKFLSKMAYGVIGFFDSSDDGLAKTFQKTADAMSADMKFAHTTDDAIKEKYGYKDTIVMFQPQHLKNKFEDAELEYNGDDAVHKIKSWISDNVRGLCAHRTPDNADKFKRPLVVAYYDVDYVKNIKGTNYWRNRIMKVGKKLQDEGKVVYFAISDAKESEREMESEYGAPESSEKPVVVARDGMDKKYVMSGEFSMDTLEQFVRDLLDGKLEPFFKSEPIPTDDGPVKTVVAKNFDDVVNNEEKDVLIEFYAPWCGHCKSLEPKFMELAEKLEDEPEITIAKMDATANDVNKPYEVSGFPTIYFAPKGSKKNPKKYSGQREVDDFMKYLAKEATNELKGYNRNGKKKKTEL